jgi:hypothetical protein
MKGRGVLLQGVLAAVGLAAAFFVWQREPVGAPGEVVVLDAPERALERVRYEDGSVQVELFREGREEGSLWLRLGTKRELRANETAEQLFVRFAPLRATRSLGVLGAEKLAEVGLKDSPRKLAVKLASGEHRFTLAAPSIGWGSPYLRRETDGHVFLLPPSMLPDLENAAYRLVDRTLHTFGASDYDTLTVTAGSTSRTFLVRARAQRPAELLPRGAPDTPDEMARKWHERVWLLAPAQADFLGRGEVPPGGEPREAFRVEYLRGAQRIGQLTVGRGAGGELYARTEYTAGWAKLPPWADSIVLDAEKVVTGR